MQNPTQPLHLIRQQIPLLTTTSYCALFLLGLLVSTTPFTLSIREWIRPNAMNLD
ncbi:hypothetical protein FA15DRAFT_675658, partial [Coprinopsis marcescibilis]